MRLCLTAPLLVLALSALALAAEPVKLDPAHSLGERSNPNTYTVDFRAIVMPPYKTKVLKVWLPLPQNDRAQEITRSELSTFPADVKPQIGNEPTFGNRFAYFEFHNPQGAQIIRHQFQATLWELNWNVDPSKVTVPENWPPSFATYLRTQAINDPQQLASALSTAAPLPQRTGADLLGVMNWIDSHLTYDHANASLKADANHALAERAGHCSDYHGLCAVMAQKLGYPSRVTYGLTMLPKHAPTHCKVEEYMPPYGWVSFDLSETQKLVKSIGGMQISDAERERLAEAVRQRLHRGWRENSWLLLTRGTNYQLAPPAVKPVALIRTIYAEADGEPLPDPDPANPDNREFASMTAMDIKAEKPAQNFDDLRLLSR